MRRNMDLCRDILLQMEDADRLLNQSIDELKEKGYSLNEIIFHCRLLHEHGFIKECIVNEVYGIVAALIVYGLTWEAHDFISSIRQDTIWNKTKDVITQKGLPMVLDVVKEISQSIVATMVQGAIKGLSQ